MFLHTLLIGNRGSGIVPGQRESRQRVLICWQKNWREVTTIPNMPVNRPAITPLQKHRFQFDQLDADLDQQLVDVVAVRCVAIGDVAMQ